MEMYFYRALNIETKLYQLGFVITGTKESAKEIVRRKFDSEKHTIYVYSKEDMADYFASSVIGCECIDLNELCYAYGYRTENELKLQKKLDAIQPLINDLSLFRN